MRKITIIIAIAFILRVIGINWDQGYHLHPDERMLIMVADQIHFFKNLNPHFFNYGSLPIYLLKGTTQFIDFFFSTTLANYNGLLLVGRSLSIIADLLVVYLLYKIASLIFKSSIALLPPLFYSITFFPIQNSHFFIVDVYLNLFVTAMVYALLLYVTKPLLKFILALAVLSAAAVATKVTAILFLPIVVGVILLKSHGTWNMKHETRKQIRSALGLPAGRQALGRLACFSLTFLFFHFLFMPYAYIEYERFLSDLLFQTKMNSNPYIFPYTLQYVDTTSYMYYLKNIFLWGWGPILSLLSIAGLVMLTNELLVTLSRHISKLKTQNFIFLITNYQLLITLLFYLLYFLVIGKSAVKFMRYMLPLYPLFAILAGYGCYKIQNSNLKAQIFKAKLKIFNNYVDAITGVIFTLAVLWTLLFLTIYFQPHTRIAASEWIHNNIPVGSTLAIEHWDDRLPIADSQRYKFVEMTLYDLPDNDMKWQILNEKLKAADYIIIASNRLYAPLQKLKDCEKYTVCYPKTAEYYEKLFAGKNVSITQRHSGDGPRGGGEDSRIYKEEVIFTKVAEFASYPGLKIENWELKIIDDSADESFTVYDHPKVMIFKNTRR